MPSKTMLNPDKMPITPFSKAAIEQAAKCLLEGGLVAFPTETVYGLGALATDDRAVARIFAAKNRPQFNPLISHFATAELALAAGQPSELANLLAKHFWPGPLTLILGRPQNSPISHLASAGADSLAVRVPGHKIANQLLAKTALPVVAPSANPSGRISPSTAQHVQAGLGNLCDMILDGGACHKGLESTVIDCRSDRPALLRPGPITPEQIRHVTGLQLDSPPIGQVPGYAPHISPGQLASHYAPNAQVRMNATHNRPDEIFIGFGPLEKGVKADFNLSEKGDIQEAAAGLFAILHKADERAVKSIAIAPIPMQGLGLAINDRLRRAAAPRAAETIKQKS